MRAIGVSGQQHGLVALNDDNEPVRPAKLWCDTSTVAQCEQFNNEFGGADEIIAMTGNAMLPGYTAPKILWLKQNEPANFRATRHASCCRTTTSTSGSRARSAWNTATPRARRSSMCARANGASRSSTSSTRGWPNMLPPVESSRKPVGLLRETLRAELGPRANVLVSAGGGDNMMGAIGTGNVAPGGAVTASLGTSGTLYA